MVPRCGYYIDNGIVRKVTANIEWNLGFDRVAKQQYVKDLHEEISKLLPGLKAVEVTSAAEPPGKWLSPIYIKFDGGKSMEDIWGEYTKLYPEFLVYDQFVWRKPLDGRAFLHYYCYYADVRLPTMRQYDVFTDVFYNPTKPGGTQAIGCACLKLMDLQKNLSVRNSIKTFCEWYESYVDI